MPRIARVVLVDLPHHVTQRGNNRQQVFFTDADYLAYLAWLKQYTEQYGLAVLAYCLMPNHVHLIVIPHTVIALSRAVGRTHLRYTQRHHLIHAGSGHLWQNRFFSCALDEEYLWTALRYVERNPERAGLVTQAWDYPWSSAAAHCGGKDTSGLLDLSAWAALCPPAAWRDQLAVPEDEEDVRLMRRQTQLGRPVGSDAFLARLEREAGLDCHPRPVGRPKKTVDGGGDE